MALVHNSGTVEAGDIPSIPDEVTSALSGHNAKLDNSTGPLPFTLFVASDSIRGGGLFFDYVPWLWLGTALAVISLLL